MDTWYRIEVCFGKSSLYHYFIVKNSEITGMRKINPYLILWIVTVLRDYFSYLIRNVRAMNCIPIFSRVLYFVWDNSTIWFAVWLVWELVCESTMLDDHILDERTWSTVLNISLTYFRHYFGTTVHMFVLW